MKKVGSGLRFFFTKFLLPAAAFFALFVLLLCIFSESGTLVRSKIFILLFGGTGIAAANLLFYVPKISIYFKVATHFILLMLILLAVLWMSGYMNTGNWVLILVGFAIGYALICPIVLVARYTKLKKNKEEKAESYTPKYK